MPQPNRSSLSSKKSPVQMKQLFRASGLHAVTVTKTASTISTHGLQDDSADNWKVENQLLNALAQKGYLTTFAHRPLTSNNHVALLTEETWQMRVNIWILGEQEILLPPTLILKPSSSLRELMNSPRVGRKFISEPILRAGLGMPELCNRGRKGHPNNHSSQYLFSIFCRAGMCLTFSCIV